MRIGLVVHAAQLAGPMRYRSDFDEEGSRKRMIFSRQFFIVAAVLGLALVGFSLDPKLLHIIFEFDYWKLLNSHFWTVSLSFLIGIGIVIAMKESGRGKDRARNRNLPSGRGSHRSSHPYNK